MAIKISVNEAVKHDPDRVLEHVVGSLCEMGRADKATLIAREVGLREGNLTQMPLEVQKREATTTEIVQMIASNCGVEIEFY